MSYKQEPPFTVQFELVEGCNRFCTFCGINGIRTGPGDYKYAELSLAEHVAKLMADAGWTARLCFAMHGEPTMHPQAAEFVRVFRKHLPKNYLMMLSNGGGLLVNTTERIDALFEAGLNVLAFDDYVVDPIVPKVLYKYKGWATVRNYPEDPEANPHHRRKPSDHEIVVQLDMSELKTGKIDSLCNHCGCAAPLNDKLATARCAKPFREFSIRWDGNVCHCCNDFRGFFKVGNIKDATHIDDIWCHERMNAVRHYLYNGMRTFFPCRGCDAYSYRVGLLPDKKGWEYLDKPTAEHQKLIEDAVFGQPYSQVILRPWERSIP